MCMQDFKSFPMESGPRVQSAEYIRPYPVILGILQAVNITGPLVMSHKLTEQINIYLPRVYSLKNPLKWTGV